MAETERSGELRALRELSEQATPGPWRNGDDDHPKPRYIIVEDQRDERGIRETVGDFEGQNADADAKFIVAAVNYVRAALSADLPDTDPSDLPVSYVLTPFPDTDPSGPGDVEAALAIGLADALTKDWPGDTRRNAAPAIAAYLMERPEVRAAIQESRAGGGPAGDETEDWRGKWDNIGDRPTRLAYLEEYWPDLLAAVRTPAPSGEDA